MKYTYWDKDIIPDGTIVYGFRADVNATFTKIFVSSKIKKYVVVKHASGFKHFHNVLKSGKVGSIAGAIYHYSLYEDAQEAIDEFELKKLKLKDTIIQKISNLDTLVKLIK